MVTSHSGARTSVHQPYSIMKSGLLLWTDPLLRTHDSDGHPLPIAVDKQSTHIKYGGFPIQ